MITVFKHAYKVTFGSVKVYFLWTRWVILVQALLFSSLLNIATKTGEQQKFMCIWSVDGSVEKL